MSQRRTVSGRRSVLVWLAIVFVLLLAIGVAAFVFVIGPQQQLRQQAQATTEAHKAEVEQLYAAGIAFQNAGDWETAEVEFKKVIALNANYKDVQSRLAEIRSKLAEVGATATAMALAQAAQARIDAQATATARAQATASARANATATAEMAPTVTLQALEAHYQKGLAYVNLEQWLEAKAELEQAFDTDPNYKDVQAQLAMVNSEVAKLTPTATPTPTDTPTPALTSTPSNFSTVPPTLANASTPMSTPTPDWCRDLDIVNIESSGFAGGNYHQRAVDFDHTGCQIPDTAWVAPNQSGWIRLTLRGDSIIDVMVIDPSKTSGVPGSIQITAGPTSDDLRAVGAYYGVWDQHQLLTINLFDPIKEDDRVIQINAHHGKEWVVIYRITWW